MGRLTLISRVALVGAAVALVAAGCAGPGKSRSSGATPPAKGGLAADQTLTINIYGVPPTLDPGVMATPAVGSQLRNVYTEALLKLATNGKSVVPSATPLVALSRGDFQMSAPIYLGPPFPDPGPLLDKFVSHSPQNYGKWGDPHYDSLVKQADATTDEATRLKLYQQAEAILLEQAAVVVLFQPATVDFIKPWVRGIRQVPFDSAGNGFPGDSYPESIYIAKH